MHVTLEFVLLATVKVELTLVAIAQGSVFVKQNGPTVGLVKNAILMETDKFIKSTGVTLQMITLAL